MHRIARALGTDDAALGVYELAKRCGAPLGLKDIGMSAEDVSKAADIASSNPYWNPRPIEREPLLALLRDAFNGVAPRAETA
jgi:maleylacetate reductase